MQLKDLLVSGAGQLQRTHVRDTSPGREHGRETLNVLSSRDALDEDLQHPWSRGPHPQLSFSPWSACRRALAQKDAVGSSFQRSAKEN